MKMNIEMAGDVPYYIWMWTDERGILRIGAKKAKQVQPPKKAGSNSPKIESPGE